MAAPRDADDLAERRRPRRLPPRPLPELPRLGPDSIEAELECLKFNDEQLAGRVRDLEKRLDTLQSPLWKRAWFRIDGWPGMRDLNAPKRAWRPWHGRRVD